VHESIAYQWKIEFKGQNQDRETNNSFQTGNTQ